VGAGSYHKRGGMTGGLTQFDVADIGQVKNPLNLQLELARVHSPEPFAKTLTIAGIDLGHPLIDCSDVAVIVEVELRQCQEQRDHRAEE